MVFGNRARFVVRCLYSRSDKRTGLKWKVFNFTFFPESVSRCSLPSS